MAQNPDYTLANREYWDSNADWWAPLGERAWAAAEPTWGIWSVPDTELNLLPSDMTGSAAIELGCGTGYVSAWMINRGATVVGIDNSARQLETAARLADEHGVELELIHGIAEQVPKPDASFDFAISEYGAAIWSDPYVWIPEAWRLLKSGGELVVIGHHPLALCAQDLDVEAPPTRTLQNPYFGMHRLTWTDTETKETGTEFNLPISEWFALFHKTGFDVLAFHELRPSESTPESNYGGDKAWSRDYPCEQAWKLRRR